MITKAKWTKIIERLSKRVIKDPIRREELVQFTRDLKVSSFNQDNFTIVTLAGPNGVASVGVSKRMPHDEWNVTIGYNIALVRAVKSFFESRI